MIEVQTSALAAWRRSFLRGSLLLLTSGCSGNSHTAPPPNATAPAKTTSRFETADSNDLTAISQALLLPQALPHLVWRQALTISAQDKSYQLEAVLQNDGETFQVLGLGPGGMKLFLVTQHQEKVSVEIFVKRKLALSPEYLLFDIQRALFWTDADPCSSRSGQPWDFENFEVRDECAGGKLVHRTVTDGPRSSAHFGSSLEIGYRPGYDFTHPPEHVKLTHEARGYQIEITQLESHRLP